MKIFSPIFRKKARSGVAGMRNTSGFTLLELMMVMVMGAVLMAIAIPMFQNLVKSKPEDELVSNLHLARMMAVRQHRPVAATIDPVANQCELRWFDNNNQLARKVWQMADKGEGYYINDAPPGGGAASDRDFRFSPMGFISADLDPAINVGGNIYLSDGNNVRHYRIQTNIAGGIELNQWSPGTNSWVPAY